MRKITVNMEGTVYYLAGATKTAVEKAVADALSVFFADTSLKIDFGRSIYLSDIFRLIDEIEGVDHVDIDKIYRVPTVVGVTGDLDTAGVFSTVTVSATTKEETWTVYFINQTTFNVTGSVSGLQGNIGTVDTVYNSDNNEISFTVHSGVVTIKTGDKATFKVSKISGNIVLSGDEFPQKGIFTFTFTAMG